MSRLLCGFFLAGDVTIVDLCRPGEEDDPAVAEQAVQEHLTRVVVALDLQGLQFPDLGQS